MSLSYLGSFIANRYRYRRASGFLHRQSAIFFSLSFFSLSIKREARQGDGTIFPDFTISIGLSIISTRWESEGPSSDPIFKPFSTILSLIVIVSRLYWLLKLNFEIATEFSRGRVIIAGSSSAPFARFLHPPCVACVKLIDDIVLHCPRHYHPHILPSSTFHPR